MNVDKFREIFKQSCTAEPLAEGWPELEKFGKAVAKEALLEAADFIDGWYSDKEIRNTLRDLAKEYENE